MRIFKPLTFILFIISMNSCTHSFRIDKDLSEKLASVSLSFHEDTLDSYEFQNHLRNILNCNSSEIKYRLEVEIDKTTTKLAIQKDAEVLRDNVQFFVKYKLYQISDDSLVYSGNFRQIGSYNTLFSPFSTNIEFESTKRNLAISAAEELRKKLILYFKLKSKGQ